MAKKVIRLTESELHSLVENSVRRIISEGGLEGFRNTVASKKRDLEDWYDRKSDEFHSGIKHTEYNSNDPLERVLHNNGWKSCPIRHGDTLMPFENLGKTRYYNIKPMQTTLGFEEFYVMPIEELIEDLNQHVGRVATVEYCGPHPNNRFLHRIKLQFK